MRAYDRRLGFKAHEDAAGGKFKTPAIGQVLFCRHRMPSRVVLTWVVLITTGRATG